MANSNKVLLGIGVIGVVLLVWSLTKKSTYTLAELNAKGYLIEVHVWNGSTWATVPLASINSNWTTQPGYLLDIETTTACTLVLPNRTTSALVAGWNSVYWTAAKS